MIASYNINSNIKSFLTGCDKLKEKILLTPLNPKTRRTLNWYFTVERIKWTASFSDTPLSDFEINKILSSPLPKKPTLQEKMIYSYKNIFEFISENWTVNPKPLEIIDIKKLFEIACKPTLGAWTGQTEISTKMVQDVLNFINSGRDHPIIQAGVIQAEFIKARLLENGNDVVARLLSYLILYKNGFDAGGYLNFDEFYRKDMVTYRELVDSSIKAESLTKWLEYYSYGAMKSLEKAYEVINKDSSKLFPSNITKLNFRQKEVLDFLANPKNKITNRDYQKMFSTSQITASRDLTRLLGLGMVLTYGKGRSVYYTKV